jgi:short chain dehydrogenase
MLTNKVALITGGAPGIGAAIARVMAGRGTRVALLDLDGAEAEKTAAELPLGMALTCDVGVEAEVASAVQAVVARSGALDILVNNAGQQTTEFFYGDHGLTGWGSALPRSGGRGSATESWSRSRESSLSIEHQSRPRRSRMEGSVSAAAPATAPVSAKTAAEKSGSSPRWSIARRAMLLSSPRLDIGGRFTVAPWVGPVWHGGETSMTMGGEDSRRETGCHRHRTSRRISPRRRGSGTSSSGCRTG